MAKETGLTLLDIGNPSELIAVGDKELSVTGISAQGCLALFVRFPELQKYLGGGGIKITELIAVAPEAIAAVIAAGTGSPSDEDAEAVAAKLPVEVQLDIMEAIGRLTFRSGFGPFVQRVIALSGQVVMLKPDNSGKGTPTTSQPALNPSSPPDTDPNTSGSTPPAK